MKRILFASVLAVLLSGCTDADSTKRAVEGAGYTNVQTQGYSVWGCAKDDVVHTSFTATDQKGRAISGTYCSGLIFKGGTIRLD